MSRDGAVIQISSSSFNILELFAGGDCAFIAISFGLAHHGVFKHHLHIRNEISAYSVKLWQNESAWFRKLVNLFIDKSYLALDEQSKSPQDYFHDLSKKRDPPIHGDDFVFMIASILFECDIQFAMRHAVNTFESAFERLKTFVPESIGFEPKFTIHLLNVNAADRIRGVLLDHWDFLQPTGTTFAFIKSRGDTRQNCVAAVDNINSCFLPTADLYNNGKGRASGILREIRRKAQRRIDQIKRQAPTKNERIAFVRKLKRSRNKNYETQNPFAPLYIEGVDPTSDPQNESVTSENSSNSVISESSASSAISISVNDEPRSKKRKSKRIAQRKRQTSELSEQRAKRAKTDEMKNVALLDAIISQAQEDHEMPDLRDEISDDEICDEDVRDAQRRTTSRTKQIDRLILVSKVRKMFAELTGTFSEHGVVKEHLKTHFRNEMEKEKMYYCYVCSERWFSRQKYSLGACKRCYSERHEEIGLLSRENKMHPAAIPDELQNLTMIEKLLICQHFPIMKVYNKERGKAGKSGPRGYTGHCINIKQDVVNFVRNFLVKLMKRIFFL